jgi:hypothetical protein
MTIGCRFEMRTWARAWWVEARLVSRGGSFQGLSWTFMASIQSDSYLQGALEFPGPQGFSHECQPQRRMTFVPSPRGPAGGGSRAAPDSRGASARAQRVERMDGRGSRHLRALGAGRPAARTWEGAKGLRKGGLAVHLCFRAEAKDSVSASRPSRARQASDLGQSRLASRAHEQEARNSTPRLHPIYKPEAESPDQQ